MLTTGRLTLFATSTFLFSSSSLISAKSFVLNRLWSINIIVYKRSSSHKIRLQNDPDWGMATKFYHNISIVYLLCVVLFYDTPLSPQINWSRARYYLTISYFVITEILHIYTIQYVSRYAHIPIQVHITYLFGNFIGPNVITVHICQEFNFFLMLLLPIICWEFHWV